MKDSLFAAFIQLENCAATVIGIAVGAAYRGGTVEIARLIADQASVGPSTIRVVLEPVQYGFVSLSGQLEHRSQLSCKDVIPPKMVVPYRLPAESRSKPAVGFSPSGDPLKLYSTVSLPLASTLNTAPTLAIPPKVVP